MKKLTLVLASAALLAACGGPEPAKSSQPSPQPSSNIPVPGSVISNSHSSEPSEKKWTVAFDSNGGSAVASAEVKDGQAVAKPTDPTKTGSYFAGWYFDQWQTAIYDFTLPVTADLTLYAGWSATPVTPVTPYVGNEFYLYTITGMPSWITADNCVVFAWTWSADDLGSWAPLTFTEGGASATFEVAYELYGFLLARCAANTTMPDWGIRDQDGPGRVYNQSQDVDCTAGVYSYACPEDKWSDYPKKS